MPIIQTYQDRVAAQGNLTARASGESFGAGVAQAKVAEAQAQGSIGAAIQNVGMAVGNLARVQQQKEIEDDVTNIHVEMAKKRVEWQQKFSDITNNTAPGDDTFVPRVMSALDDDMNSFGETVKTQKGQQLFARMRADMTAMYGQEAISTQARLNGEFAKNQYNDISDSLSSVASQDHTQWRGLVDSANAAIDDPDGRFARVPAATREAFKQNVAENIKFAAAKGFVRRYPQAVLGSVPTELRESVQKVIADPPKPGVPPDLGASNVKPYDQKKIDYISKSVDAPSPYDAVFKEAANQYNLDWREIKMRAVVESGLNPKAMSNQGAGGIMQFTEATAKAVGVDRMDPRSAIFGAAKLLSNYRTQAGGDMSKVDMMYYGGESGKAWGPNTKQYAANLSAVRQTIGLGAATPPEAFAPSPVEQTGASQEWKKPSTGIDFIDSLPADKFFAVISEAEQYQRAFDTQSERRRVESENAKRDQQEQTMNLMTQRIVNPTAENGGQLTEVEIVSNPNLTAAQMQHMITYLSTYTNYKQDAQRVKTDSATYNELYRRINAPTDDPSKLYDPAALYDALKDGRLTPPDHSRLMENLRALKDGSGGGFQRDMNSILGNVARELQASPVIQGLSATDPGLPSRAVYEFQRDLESKVDELRAAGKDPRGLLDPASPEYMLKPGYLNKYVPSLGQAASAVKQGLTPGTVVDGYKFKGGDPGNKSNWEKV